MVGRDSGGDVTVDDGDLKWIGILAIFVFLRTSTNRKKEYARITETVIMMIMIATTTTTMVIMIIVVTE